jgi:hypothetical protein
MGEVAYRAAYGTDFPWIWGKLSPIESARWERVARAVVKEYLHRESESRPWGYMDPAQEEPCENLEAGRQDHQVVESLHEIDQILDEATAAPTSHDYFHFLQSGKATPLKVASTPPSPRVGLPIELL